MGFPSDPALPITHSVTGLKSLTELCVRPFRGRGITDGDLLQTQRVVPEYLAHHRGHPVPMVMSSLGLPSLTALVKLEFRGCADMLSDEVRRHVS